MLISITLRTHLEHIPVVLTSSGERGWGDMVTYTAPPIWIHGLSRKDRTQMLPGILANPLPLLLCAL